MISWHARDYLLACCSCQPNDIYQTASHFNTLNMQITNENVLERILIATLNDNEADCNENFMICAEESVGPLYKQ